MTVMSHKHILNIEL